MLRGHNPSVKKKKSKINFSKRALSNLSFKTKLSYKDNNYPQKKQKTQKEIVKNDKLLSHQYGSFKGHRRKNTKNKLQKSRDFFEGYHQNLSFVILNEKTQKNNRFRKCIKSKLNQFTQKKQSRTQNKLAKNNKKNTKVLKNKPAISKQETNFNSRIEDLHQNIQKQINQQKKKKNKLLSKKKSIEIDMREIQNSFQKTKSNQQLSFSILFQQEKILYEFLNVKNQSIFLSNFEVYFQFIQKNSIDQFLEYLSGVISENQLQSIKESQILERFFLIFIYKLLQQKKHEKEFIFLEKIIKFIYSNSIIFIHILLGSLKNNNKLSNKEQFQLEVLENRLKNLTFTIRQDMKNNNRKILKYIKCQINILGIEKKDNVYKFMEFYEDFKLDEATNMLFDIFQNKHSILHDSKSNSLQTNSSQKISQANDQKQYKLILDLDETLVYYQDNRGQEIISLRPFLREFLDQCSVYYQIIVFTQSIKEYAQMIVNYIDYQKKYINQIHYRKIDQEDTRYKLIQDLQKKDANLEKTIIIEKSNSKTDSNKENSICIKPWYGQKNDQTLKNLLPILLRIPQENIDNIKEFLEQYKKKLIENIQKGSLNL